MLELIEALSVKAAVGQERYCSPSFPINRKVCMGPLKIKVLR